jgi:hypothetical protein
LISTAKQIKDGTAGGIGQSLKSSLGVPQSRICNLSVTHNA